ncbi:IS66 family transposase [Nostoc sp.]|uniref:IS66 family transposase n=1 Tax=Nostoc sp. TaxID=1180 RepID=UPI002FF4A228
MTQKLLSSDKSGSDLLQAIDPSGIADESMRRTVEILLNLVEELNSKIKGLELENQQLRDENNRLKGEQGKPDIKSKNKKGLSNNHSSEKELLDTYLPKLGSQQRTRIMEAAAIAFYHQQTDWPVVETLVCDDAPQFKLLTDDLALCWVHEGRHYKKLSPVVACHQQALDKFLDDFWDYYRDLLAYKDSPSEQPAEKLRSEFYQLFDADSGYQQLDERKRLTAAKIKELLLVLEHPELPLHNNPAELAARTMVQRRNISYATCEKLPL